MRTNSPNFRTASRTQISGGYASGTDGYIDIRYQSTNLSLFPTQVAATTVSLDVANWSIEQIFDQKPLACSGLFGATKGRQTGYRYQFQATVIWDLRAVPETLLRGIDGCSLYFWLGQYNFNQAGTQLLTSAVDRYYWCPFAALQSAKPILDANGKRMTRTLIQGVCRSHVMLIPDMGDPSDTGTLAGAYNKYVGAI